MCAHFLCVVYIISYECEFMDLEHIIIIYLGRGELKRTSPSSALLLLLLYYYYYNILIYIYIYISCVCGRHERNRAIGQGTSGPDIFHAISPLYHIIMQRMNDVHVMFLNIFVFLYA